MRQWCKIINHCQKGYKMTRQSYYRSSDTDIGTATTESLELMHLIDEEYTCHTVVWLQANAQLFAPSGVCGVSKKDTTSNATHGVGVCCAKILIHYRTVVVLRRARCVF